MYKMMVIIFLSWISLGWATDYYVDKNANGSNNGTSWSNAWESFAAIVWGSLDPGDFLYISGGSDSTIYYETLKVPAIQGTAANPITIIAGKYAPSSAGHSGRVIIDGSGGSLNWNILVGKVAGTPSYITIKGFKCRRALSAIKVEDYANAITIDSNYCYEFYGLAGVFVCGFTDGIDSTVIKNNTIITWVDQPNIGSAQTDGIYLCETVNTLITDNYIWIRNQDPFAHVDGIQTWYPKNIIVIKNNVLINDSVYSPEGGGMPLIVRSHLEEDGLPIIFYNNFCYMGGVWLEGANNGNVMDMHSGDLGNKAAPPTYILHNTIVGNGPQLHGVSFSYFGLDFDGTFVNNLVAQYGDGLGTINWYDAIGTSSTTDVDSVRNSLVWREWEANNPSALFGGSWTNGSTTNSNLDWSDWIALGGTGVNSQPLFVNNFGNEPDQGALRGYLQPGSPAISQGENAEWYINWLNATYNLEGEWALEWKDINGYDRDNHPDIGAYQYTGRGVDTIQPGVTGAILLDSITLKIMFSEALDETTAEDENNYSISNNIDIFNASLSGSAVTLQTTTHSPGSYIVTVVNVEDLAGNTISQSNTAEYSLLPPIPSDSLIMFLVEDVYGVIQEPGHTPLKTIDGLGALSGDPDSRWAAEPMPEELIFDLGSSRNVSKTKLSFYMWNLGRVYSYSTSISNDNNNWVTIVSQATSASNEEWTIDEFPAVDARYVKVLFINNTESDWAGLWEGEIWGIITSVADPVGVNLRSFLEGPYNDDAMLNDLSDQNLIPLTQPYYDTPWNYPGDESVSEIPNEVVDWVLLEIRSGIEISSIVARRAAFLVIDGTIKDLNGEPTVEFPEVSSGHYYVVVHHRNHLSIMTKDPIYLSESFELYDFTTSLDKAYGNQPMKQLAGGKFGLYAADGNANGNINRADNKNIWRKQNGSVGYKSGDYDMNGGVNIRDKNAKYKPNKGKNTGVPMN